MTYSVVEVFRTLQGEGSRAGTSAVFVRLGGCNLWNGRPSGRALGRGACATWCDTKFTGGRKQTATELVDRCDALWPGSGERWIVLTGGEPCLQLDAALVGAFRARGWSLAIETNGTQQNAALELLDHVTLSPKKGPPIVVKRCTDLKVVLPGWTAEELDALQVEAAFRFVQPQDPPQSQELEDTVLRTGGLDDLRRNVQVCLGFIDRNPGWRLSLQLHKLLGLP